MMAQSSARRGSVPSQPPSGVGEGARHTVAHVLAGGRLGGLESVVRLLASGLTGLGHRVHTVLLLDPDDPGDALSGALERAGARVHRLHHGPRAIFAERRALHELLRELAPDVVHTHGYRADIQAPRAARRLGVPLVSTLHGFTGGGPKLRLYEWLQLRSLRRHDRLVAVSGPVAARLRGAGLAPGRITVVQNAWAPQSAIAPRETARAELGLDPGARVVGWVGRLSAEKGPDVLVEAARHLGRRDVTLCFIGDGPLRATLLEASQVPDVRARVVFAGARDDAERLYGAFDVFALSSRTEGTPMVLFEAMQAGVPIVATRVGGVPDVLDDASAWLVDPDAPEALAAALDAALGGAAAARRRTDAAQRVLAERFALEPWLRAYEAIYAALLD